MDHYYARSQQRQKFLRHQKLFKVILILGIIFIASNLRAPLTSVGPVLQEISESLALSNLSASLMTTIPLLCFAGLSTFAPHIARRIGIERLLLLSVLILILGLSLRPLGSVSFLMLGVTLIGFSITIGNVLMPAFIKKYFPDHTGLMTGVYSVSMNLSAALAAGFSIPIGQYTDWGWKGSIGIWVVLGILTFFIWMPINAQAKYGIKPVNHFSSSKIWASKMAWSVAMFMGFQSFIFYAIMTWGPQMMMSWGISESQAGWSISYIQLAQLPFTFITPIIASRMKSQQPLIIGIVILILSAFGMLLFFKAEYLLFSCIILGIGTGSAFSLAMMFFVLKTNATSEAAALSGMSQSIGYFIASFGPPIFGYLYDRHQSWHYSIFSLIIVAILILITGLYAAQKKKI